MSTSLIVHCGARVVSREQLECVPAPEATATWFPVKHALVIDTVRQSLHSAGFQVQREQFALSRGDARLFATLDLTSSLANGVHLAVGIRNSTDKSLPLGFCAGNRVVVCDNLAFRSELLVSRRHTRHGATRFEEAIVHAAQSLVQFREVESRRIERYQAFDLAATQADSLMLRAYEAGLLSHRVLPQVIHAWRQPEHDQFAPRTVWSLLNAFTSALSGRQKSNPQQFAALTIRLQDLLDRELSLSEPTPVTAA